MASTTKTKGPPPDPPKPLPSSGKSQSDRLAEKGSARPAARPSATRETIESIVVAFVLAFLFKTFEAEAFVIPTGSMAPTLMGRHKDVHCPMCGFDFRIGVSDELEKETDYVIPERRIVSATCPNCRYHLPRSDVYDLPAFKGDRILVTKFSYEIADPKRWDTGVFKYPEEPKTNYIKRIVGLPNDTIEIRQGDVYRQTDQGEEILRKDDPNKQRVLQLTVYDNDHPERPLLDAGWPERWAAVRKTTTPPADAIAGWSPDAAGWLADGKDRSFRLTKEKGASELRWIRYRNFVPKSDAWASVAGHNKPTPPKPELITDFCGYNAISTESAPDDDLGIYWVGDLTINCHVDIHESDAQGQLLLELNEGPRVYRCRFDLSNGRATLSYAEPHDPKDPGDEHQRGTAQTRVVGTGAHDLAFANVDNRLCLWVDGRLVDFGDKVSYEPYGGLQVQTPWAEDLIPVGVAARGADVTVSHLFLQRDIYYRCDFYHPSRSQSEDSGELEAIEEYNGIKWNLISKLAEPAEWFREYEQGLSSRQTGPGEKYAGVSFQFKLGSDEFFMMGDNSPRSQDSRLWPNRRHAAHRYAVPRIALVGKAFFVYWPHGVPFLNDGRGYPDGLDSIWDNKYTARFFYHYKRDPDQGVVIDKDYPMLRIPFYPNFQRMRRIR